MILLREIVKYNCNNQIKAAILHKPAGVLIILPD